MTGLEAGMLILSKKEVMKVCSNHMPGCYTDSPYAYYTYDFTSSSHYLMRKVLILSPIAFLCRARKVNLNPEFLRNSIWIATQDG